jgi:indole-3-glycerol phosphate synthase
MPPVSRLSQALSEGDGISILVEVTSAEAAAAAEGDGADVLAVRRDAGTVRASTQLPLLDLGDATVGATVSDAVVIPPELGHWERARSLGVECVVRVTSSDDLERALEELDPELFLLAVDESSDDDPLETLLALLHDVPAGKLAIAELSDATADDVAELERAGVDGVLVAAADVTALVGAEPPEVP